MEKKVLAAFMAQQQQSSVNKASPDYDPTAHSMAPRKGHTNAAVVIIGAGISGMCMAIDLIRKNKTRDFVILEKGSQIGGTWSDSKYPGCCCDVWGHLYSYSFEPNASWTREYPGQEEIYAYLVGVAEKWGLYRHIRFNTSVDAATWSAATKTWDVRVSVSGAKTVEHGAAYTIAASFLVSAVGQLSTPYTPPLPNLPAFTGKLMHAARWDWSHPLEGLRVGIIGSGATAAQIIPELAKICSSLTVFQRTPNWVIPRDDKPIPPAARAALRYVPGLRARYRALLMDVREALFDSAFRRDAPGNEGVRKWAGGYMRKQLPDRPDLWEKLTPDYAPGCKRIIMSDDFYPALAQPHVVLETRPITRVTSTGVAVASPSSSSEGEESYDFDLLILATGYRAQDFLSPIQITGANGHTLSDLWSAAAGGPQAFRGVTVPDMPNFGLLYGPNTNLGHSSIILMVEAQTRYLSALMAPVLAARERGAGGVSVAPRAERTRRYNEELQERMRGLAFADAGCKSWYKSEGGVVVNNWAGTVVEYQEMMAGIEWGGEYEVEGEGGPGGRQEVGRVVEETVVPVLGIMAGAVGAVVVAVGWRAVGGAAGVRRVVGKVF